MKHILENIDLELVIQLNESGVFKATTPLFPTCKGCAETQELAVEKLILSISGHISRSVKSHLKARFSEEKFSNVVTDPENHVALQHRVYPKKSPKEYNQTQVFLSSLASTLNRVGNGSEHTTLDESPLDLLLQQFQKKGGDPILGITLCLN